MAIFFLVNILYFEGVTYMSTVVDTMHQTYKKWINRTKCVVLKKHVFKIFTMWKWFEYT